MSNKLKFVACPSCGHPIRISSSIAIGTRISCAHCGASAKWMRRSDAEAQARAPSTSPADSAAPTFPLSHPVYLWPAVLALTTAATVGAAVVTSHAFSAPKDQGAPSETTFEAVSLLDRPAPEPPTAVTPEPVTPIDEPLPLADTRPAEAVIEEPELGDRLEPAEQPDDQGAPDDTFLAAARLTDRVAEAEDEPEEPPQPPDPPPALVLVPDVLGLSLQQAFDVLEDEGFEPRMRGRFMESDVVYRQIPVPGVRVEEGFRVEMEAGVPAPNLLGAAADADQILAELGLPGKIQVETVKTQIPPPTNDAIVQWQSVRPGVIVTRKKPIYVRAVRYQYVPPVIIQRIPIQQDPPGKHSPQRHGGFQ